MDRIRLDSPKLYRRRRRLVWFLLFLRPTLVHLFFSLRRSSLLSRCLSRLFWALHWQTVFPFSLSTSSRVALSPSTVASSSFAARRSQIPLSVALRRRLFLSSSSSSSSRRHHRRGRVSPKTTRASSSARSAVNLQTEKTTMRTTTSGARVRVRARVVLA